MSDRAPRPDQSCGNSSPCSARKPASCSRIRARSSASAEFASRRQHSLSIGGAQQPPATPITHSDAIGLVHLGTRAAEASGDVPHHCALPVIRARDPELRRADDSWETATESSEAFARLSQYGQRTHGHIKGVVKSRPPIIEKDMPAHLACKRRAFAQHARADHRVPRG